MTTYLVTLLGLATITGTAAAQENGSSPQRATRAELVATVDSVANDAVARGIVGVSVAVVQGADTIVAAGYGLADAEAGLRASERTVYRLGALSEQFTAALVLRLAEDGALSLKEDVRRYLPEFLPAGAPISLRQLLTHTSGIRAGRWERDLRMPRERSDLGEEATLATFKDSALAFAPGSHWLYAGEGYRLLAAVVEHATHLDFDKALHEWITGPLGLADTGECPAAMGDAPRAAGYVSVSAKRTREEPFSQSQIVGAEALCSSALDLVRWMRRLPGETVLSASSVREMWSPARLTGDDASAPLPYGLGVRLGTLEGHFKLGHAGSLGGFSAVATHYPADSLTIAVLGNTRGAGLPDALQLEEAIARRALGVSSRQAAVRLPPEEVPWYAGEYLAYEDGAETLYYIVARDGKLFERGRGAGAPAHELEYLGDGRFRYADMPSLELTFLPAGRSAEWMASFRGGLLHRVGRRVK